MSNDFHTPRRIPIESEDAIHAYASYHYMKLESALFPPKK